MTYSQLPSLASRRAFSLLEMAIVLVVIGLVVGGVLVGRDMIAAGKIQAQIGQINQYNTAVNAFESKFNDLPGDIRASRVARFGFTGGLMNLPVPNTPRRGSAAEGDGNGLINGISAFGPTLQNGMNNGETRWFWIDLSTNSNLIDGSFNNANDDPRAAGPLYSSTANPRMTLILPRSKIANDVFIYPIATSAWNMGNDVDKTLFNHFVIASVQWVDGNGAMTMGNLPPGLTTLQAYTMDLKMDDGAPQTGFVTARYEHWGFRGLSMVNYPDGVGGASGGGTAALPVLGAIGTAATPASANTCYDNGNSATNAAQRYTLNQTTQNRNCALMIRFK